MRTSLPQYRLRVPVALAALSLAALAGCDNPSDAPARPPPPSQPLAHAPTSPAPPAAPSAQAADPSSPGAALPGMEALAVPIASRKVAARDLGDGAWMPEFTFQRDVGDEGLTFIAVAARCVEKGLALCTSTQWQVACEADPAVRALETWTASRNLSGGLVIRGGGRTCSEARSAPGSGTSPFRAGACCSRAIAIQTSTPPTAVMKSTATKLLAFEKALNRRSGLAVRELLEDPVQLYTKKQSRESAGGTFDSYFHAHSDFWVIHDKCDVSFQKQDDTWMAECRKYTQQEGKLSDTSTRYLWGGTSAKIRSLTDSFIYREFSDP